MANIVNYVILENETPKAGDYVINPIHKSNIPHIVEQLDNKEKTLGIRLNGWFSWLPLCKHHKVIKINS